jgi:asparagine synthetase B (glutamine-hydrolysing)
VHQDGRGGVAFRGYLLEPAVHGWCDSSDVLDASWDRPPDPPNGAFAAARLDDRTGELELETDALGMGALFYRTWGRAVLFATGPRYLRLPGDVLDAAAWRLRIASAMMTCDDSPIEGIHRVPHGCRVRFREGRPASIESYLPPDLFRPVVRPADRGLLERLEATFVRAMERCCALPGLRALLPLSAGHDSRRILGALLQLGVPFEALTMRIPDRRGRDVDARYAAELAARYGFPHRVLDLPGPGRFAALDRDRRLLMHGESLHHAWILPLLRELPAQPAMILDGLAGDVLGETGYMEWALVRPDATDKDLCDRMLNPAFEPLFRAPFWPPRETARARLLKWLGTLPRVLRGEWMFLLTRSRREIASWSRRLVPAGHVTAYPYLDLDYLRLAFEVDPAERMRESTQARCLAEFHPELAAIPGSRSVPEGLPSAGLDGSRARDLRCLRALEAEVLPRTTAARLRELLPRKFRLLHWAARFSSGTAERVAWWRTAVLEMLAVEQASSPAWRPTEGASASAAG